MTYKKLGQQIYNLHRACKELKRMLYFSVLLLSLEWRSTTSNQASGALDIGLPKQSCQKFKTSKIIPCSKIST
jgi:hypothetical protein